MARIGVAILKIKIPTEKPRALVLDGIRTADRPAALGEFILSSLREWYQKYKFLPQVTLETGLVEHSELRTAVDLRTTTLTEDWFGRLYELQVAVERGDPELLVRGSEDGAAES